MAIPTSMDLSPAEKQTMVDNINRLAAKPNSSIERAQKNLGWCVRSQSYRYQDYLFGRF